MSREDQAHGYQQHVQPEARLLRPPKFAPAIEVRGPNTSGRGVRCIAYSPDGTRVATGGDFRSIRVWPAVSPPLAAAAQAKVDLARTEHVPAGGDRASPHLNSVQMLEWSPAEVNVLASACKVVRDGKVVVEGGLRPGVVCIWDLDSPKEPLFSHKFPHEVLAISFHPSGEHLAVTWAATPMDEIVFFSKAFDVDDKGKPKWTRREDVGIGGPGIQMEMDEINSIRFSHSGKLLLFASNDGAISAWRYPTERRALVAPAPDPSASAAAGAVAGPSSSRTAPTAPASPASVSASVSGRHGHARSAPASPGGSSAPVTRPGSPAAEGVAGAAGTPSIEDASGDVAREEAGAEAEAGDVAMDENAAGDAGVGSGAGTNADGDVDMDGTLPAGEKGPEEDDKPVGAEDEGEGEGDGGMEVESYHKAVDADADGSGEAEAGEGPSVTVTADTDTTPDEPDNASGSASASVPEPSRSSRASRSRPADDNHKEVSAIASGTGGDDKSSAANGHPDPQTPTQTQPQTQPQTETQTPKPKLEGQALYKARQLTRVKSQLVHTAMVLAVGLCPTGKYIALGGQDALLSLLRTRDWMCVRQFDHCVGPIRHISFSPDGEFIAYGSDDTDQHIYITSTHSGALVHTIKLSSTLSGIAWHPRENWLAYCAPRSQSDVCTWYVVPQDDDARDSKGA